MPLRPHSVSVTGSTLAPVCDLKGARTTSDHHHVRQAAEQCTWPPLCEVAAAEGICANTHQDEMSQSRAATEGRRREGLTLSTSLIDLIGCPGPSKAQLATRSASEADQVRQRNTRSDAMTMLPTWGNHSARILDHDQHCYCLCRPLRCMTPRSDR